MSESVTIPVTELAERCLSRRRGKAAGEYLRMETAGEVVLLLDAPMLSLSFLDGIAIALGEEAIGRMVFVT